MVERGHLPTLFNLVAAWALIAFQASAADESWQEQPTNLSEGTGSSFPHIAINQEGKTIVTWYGGSSTTFYRIAPNGNDWRQIEDGPSGVDIDVAVLPDGSFVRMFPQQGARFQRGEMGETMAWGESQPLIPEQTPGDLKDRARRETRVLDDGSLFSTWLQKESGYWRLYSSRVNPDNSLSDLGQASLSQENISAGRDYSLEIAPNGSAAVLFSSFASGEYRTRSTRFTAGAWSPFPQTVAYPTEGHTAVYGASLANNDFMLSWIEEYDDAGTSRIGTRILDSSGELSDAVVHAETNNPTAEVDQAATAADPTSGNGMLVWLEEVDYPQSDPIVKSGHYQNGTWYYDVINTGAAVMWGGESGLFLVARGSDSYLLVGRDKQSKRLISMSYSEGAWSGPDYGPSIEVGTLSNVTVAPDGEVLALLEEPQTGADLLLVRYGAKYHQPATGLPIWLLYEASKQP